MKTLSRFSVVLPEHHDLDAAALAELTKSVTAVLGLGGSGVTMAEEGQLQFVTAVSPDSKELERSQEEHQEGPCRDAYETGEVVRVTDVRQESARWPHYAATATRLGLAGVAGIPMRDGDEVIGALNIYSSEPRQWSDEDIAVAVVLADVATTYVLNAAKLHDQEQLSQQLQQALDSRVVIEQAKGSPPIRTRSRSIRPTSSCGGTHATTTPACAWSLRRSLAWDSRSELDQRAQDVASPGWCCITGRHGAVNESLRRARCPTCPPHPRPSDRGPPRSPTDHAWCQRGTP